MTTEKTEKQPHTNNIELLLTKKDGDVDIPYKPLNQDKKCTRKSSSSSLNNSNPPNLARLQVPGQSSTAGGNVGRRWRSIRHAVRVTNAAVSMKKGLNRDDSFLKKFSTRQPYRADSVGTIDEHLENNQSEVESRSKHLTVLQPDGNIMFYWLCILTLSILYNLWTCIAREAFREIQERNMMAWIGCDIFCDSIYVFDIFVQIRTGYLDKGIMVYNSKKLLMRYVRTKDLVLDLASLIPLDFLQFSIGVHPMLRFPRFLKVYRSFRFLHLLETRTHFPNFFRVANLTHILFLGSHWFASFYYMISEAEDFEGDWSYPKPVGQFATVTRKYLTSLFWSTLTLTTIGDLPPPESNWEYVFVIVSYLIGVFIFATIVGQVGNVITNRNASRQEFERLLDGAKLYMRMHNVPQDVQKRVQRWYDYVWTRGRMKGSDINSLGLLPDKLKTELAIHVNLETLKRVTIFQECQPEFLHDLVLKMKAYIFTPGDLICRQGEVAREMFIIADGLVEIISESGTVLTKMETGDFFGEIGILNLDGGINRRTADVKSVGYSELFVLSREDVLEALKDHPEAERVIREYGQQRLKEIEVHRQKMKFSVSDFQTKWSPNSPARYLRGSPSKQIRVVKSKKAPGVLINNVSKRKSRKKKFLGAMKDLAMKTGYKGGSTHSQDRTEIEQTEQQDCWPVIAKLPQGDIIAIKENHKPRKFSFPTIVEKAMEANKRGLLICEKNKVSDDLAGVTKSVDSSSKQCDLTIKRNAQEDNLGYTNQHPENSVANDGPNYLLSKRLNQSPTTFNKQSANNSTISANDTHQETLPVRVDTNCLSSEVFHCQCSTAKFSETLDNVSSHLKSLNELMEMQMKFLLEIRNHQIRDIKVFIEDQSDVNRKRQQTEQEDIKGSDGVEEEERLVEREEKEERVENINPANELGESDKISSEENITTSL